MLYIVEVGKLKRIHRNSRQYENRRRFTSVNEAAEYLRCAMRWNTVYTSEWCTRTDGTKFCRCYPDLSADETVKPAWILEDAHE